MPELPLGDWVEQGILWLLDTFTWFFDGISAVMTALVDAITAALLGPPPVVWVALFALAAFFASSWRLSLYSVLAFGLIWWLGLWTETMETLGLVAVAATLAALIGLPLGIWAAKSRPVRITLRPILDWMQTTPAFVYLIPAVFFFGVGVVPGVVATTIFAIPPGVRLTALGIRQVDAETVEASAAFGASPRQILREVQIPLALPSIMAGINQVIMLALSMVVVAGLTGAAGLGAVVVRAVTQLDIASGFEGGLAVVLLAVYLDRVTSALAEQPAAQRRGRKKPARTSADEAIQINRPQVA
jgi:glycine betaine/proline transport system permease protein